MNYDCCPFKTTPGRFVGQWTNCIHGLIGRKNEILKELNEIEDQIFLWQTNNPRSQTPKTEDNSFNPSVMDLPKLKAPTEELRSIDRPNRRPRKVVCTPPAHVYDLRNNVDMDDLELGLRAACALYLENTALSGFEKVLSLKYKMASMNKKERTDDV